MGKDQMMEKLWGVEGLIGVVVVLTLVAATFREKARSKRFAPGPFAWPIIGHLHLFASLPHAVLRDLSRRYGPVLGLRLGQQRAVVVSSPELAKIVLLTHDKLFADRPPYAFTSVMIFGSRNGLTFTRYGPEWRTHRKLCTLQLFTAKRMQELQYVRQEETRNLLLSIHQQSMAVPAGTGQSTLQRQAIDIGRCMGQMSCRIIMRLLQSSATMPEIGGDILPELIKEAEQLVGPIYGDLIPYLSCLDFFRKRRMRRFHDRFDKIYTEMIKERKESSRVKMDLLGLLLSQEDSLGLDGIKAILHDITTAGIHTTALTMEWAMAELLKNPQSLHRLQNEIDTQVSADKKQVLEEDLPNLKYLKSVVKETFRLHPVAPLLVPRMSTEECGMQGYVIPAKTLMFVNVWAIGRDEQVWPKASEFIPERFENRDVDLKGQHFELLPFGAGRRLCVGLPLALSVIETTLANLVGWFDWELPNGQTHASINMDEKSGITNNKAIPVIAIPKPRRNLIC